jgi:hypothetical protein
LLINIYENGSDTELEIRAVRSRSDMSFKWNRLVSHIAKIKDI